MGPIKALTLAGCVAATLLAAQAQENYGLWGRSKAITINTSATGANIADTLYNFPLLVRLDSNQADVFAQSKQGGADLRFRSFPGPALPYKIESWDSAAKKAEIWVSVDRILGNSATQVIHMLWQKSDAAAVHSDSAVFDSAKGFVAVWHMGGASGSRANAVRGGVPAVPASTVVDSIFTGRSTTGLIGTADTLRGGNAAGGEYFDVSPMPGFGTGFTFSFWANISSTTDRSWMRFFDFGNGEAVDNLFAGRNGTTTTVRWDVFPGQFIDAAGALVTNQWKHYVMTVAAIDLLGGQPSATELFVDGVSVGANAGTYQDVERASSYLGRSNWAADAYFTGKMDEVQISKVARPAGWAKLSYETQKPGANLLTFGASGPPVSVSPAASAAPAARALRVTPAGRGYTFALPAASTTGAVAMRVSVLDMQGRAVWSSSLDRGASSIAWNGLAANGQPIARGMYFVRVAPAFAGPSAAVWESRFAHMR